MKINEFKDYIRSEFKRVYGFSPCKKDIRPLETFGYSGHIEWMGFHVGGIGYECRANSGLVKSETFNI